jgi:hypothetical protein
MSLNDEVEMLRKIQLFAKVEPAKLKLLAFTSERAVFEPDEVLFHQGDRRMPPISSSMARSRWMWNRQAAGASGSPISAATRSWARWASSAMCRATRR